MRKATHEKVQMYAIGEAGGQIGEIFKLNQYDVVAYNTAKADLDKLKHITDKRLIGVTEGSGKDRKLSANSFKENEAKIRTALTQDLENKEIAFIFTSMSGGTGSGSAIKLADEIRKLGKKAVIVAVKPIDGEIGKSMTNYLQFLGEYEKVKNEIPLIHFENNANYQVKNKEIYDSLNNFLNPEGISTVTFDFMDSFKAFRRGYCVLQTGTSEKIQINTMFDLTKADNAVLISCTPQNIDGYALLKQNNFGTLDRQFYEYTVQNNPSWTLLLCDLQLPIDVISTLAKEQNQIAQIMNAKKDTLNINILDID